MSGVENPFGGFDEQWAGTEPAERGNAFGRVPPAVYKVVCAAVDPGPGVMIDHEILDNREKGKSLGLKVFFEILSPEAIMNPVSKEPEVTKGRIVEHVFWVTEKTLAFLKRDVETITGKKLAKASDLLTIAWAGQTCEIGVRDEEYNGYVNSRVNYINAWDPKKPAAPPRTAKAGAAAPPGAVAPTSAAVAPPSALQAAGGPKPGPATAAAAGKGKKAAAEDLAF